MSHEQITPLHVRSGFSPVRGCLPLEQLISAAAEMGHDHLALTDMNNICAAPRFWRQASEAGLRPIIGAELRMDAFVNKHVQGPATSAIALVENDNSVLADIALLEMARIDVQASDTARALAELNRLIEEFPESYYMPFGLKGKADLLVADDGRREEAVAIYRRILEHYPNYPFGSEVREAMRRLEENKIG